MDTFRVFADNPHPRPAGTEGTAVVVAEVEAATPDEAWEAFLAARPPATRANLSRKAVVALSR